MKELLEEFAVDTGLSASLLMQQLIQDDDPSFFDENLIYPSLGREGAAFQVRVDAEVKKLAAENAKRCGLNLTQYTQRLVETHALRLGRIDLNDPAALVRLPKMEQGTFPLEVAS